MRDNDTPILFIYVFQVMTRRYLMFHALVTSVPGVGSTKLSQSYHKIQIKYFFFILKIGFKIGFFFQECWKFQGQPTSFKDKKLLKNCPFVQSKKKGHWQGESLLVQTHT